MQPTTSQPIAPPKKRKSLWFRLLRGGAVVFLLLLLAIFSAPLLLDSAWVRAKIASELAANAGTSGTLGSFKFSWVSGIRAEKLVIANPPGFSADEPMLTLDELHGGISWSQLLRGNYSLDLHAKGLRARVVQRDDGTTNVEVVKKRQPSREPSHPSGHEESATSKLLAKLRLDLTLDDATFEVRQAKGGVVESMTQIRAQVKKDLGDGPIRCSFAAALQSGRIEFEATVDPTFANPAHVHLVTSGVELAHYKPLLAPFLMPGDLTELSGKLGGEVTLEADVRTEHFKASGELIVAEPRIAGSILRGVDLNAPRWVLQPVVDVRTDKQGTALDLVGLHCDLGLGSIDGLSSSEAASLVGGAKALGCAFALDASRLGVAATGDVHGKMAIVVPERWDGVPTVIAHFATTRATYQGQTLEGFAGEARWDGGKLSIENSSGSASKLNGGPFGLSLRAQTDQTKQMPAELTLAWNGGSVGASAVPALQYFVPVLAGLAGQANLDFQSKIDTKVSFRGPLTPKAGQSVLEWLDAWSGSGDLHLLQGSFTPSRELAGILEFAGAGKKLAFDKLGGKFQLARGFVTTALDQLGIRGRTSLSGSMEYVIDVGTLLKGHRDGEKLLKALGNRSVEAGLSGTLANPKLVLPDLTKLVVESQLPGLLEDLLFKKKK